MWEERFPHIAWREPIMVSVAGAHDVQSALCCRICVARSGLRAQDVKHRRFRDRARFERHLRDVHGARA